MTEWTDEQKALRKSLDPYFERLSAGHIEDDANAVFPREKWELIRETGVLGLPFDPEWGGLGQDALTMVYVLEHLGHGCRDGGLLFTLATQIVSVALPIHKFGSDELKERYLRRLIDGEILGARDLRTRRNWTPNHDDDGHAGRRLLRHQRQEGVLHERAGRRCDHGVR